MRYRDFHHHRHTRLCFDKGDLAEIEVLFLKQQFVKWFNFGELYTGKFKLSRFNISMPKSKKTKYYAVSVGRGGPMIYSTWDEVRFLSEIIYVTHVIRISVPESSQY